MPRIALVQVEAGSCPIGAPQGYSIIVYPPTDCPPPYAARETAVILPRGDHVEVITGGRVSATPCNSVITVQGVKLYTLCTISYRCGYPVLFVNLSGVQGGRVYTGRTGIYDYEAGVPIALGGVGEGHISYEIPRVSQHSF